MQEIVVRCSSLLCIIFSAATCYGARPDEKFNPSLLNETLDNATNAPRLLCYYDASKNVYSSRYFDWARWNVLGFISPSALKSFAHGEDIKKARGNVVRASDVYRHVGNMIPVIDDIASRLQMSWWLYGGSLIGALRYKSVVPWDNDLDFCFGDKLKLSELKQSFGVTQDVDLGGGMRGFLLHSVDKPDHILAYAPGHPEFYVYHLRSGFKAELKYDQWHCFHGREFVEPVQRVELHAGDKTLSVPIPRDPMNWLNSVNYHPREVSMQKHTVEMPLDHWTRCCKSRQDVREYVETPSLPSVFVFRFTKDDERTVKFEHRKNVGMPPDCSEVSSSTVDVKSLY